jgi:hypothetical protein
VIRIIGICLLYLKFLHSIDEPPKQTSHGIFTLPSFKIKYKSGAMTLEFYYLTKGWKQEQKSLLNRRSYIRRPRHQTRNPENSHWPVGQYKTCARVVILLRMEKHKHQGSSLQK